MRLIKSPKMHLVTDGARIYLSELSGGHVLLAKVSGARGKSFRIRTPLISVNPAGDWCELALDGSGLYPEEIKPQETWVLAAELP